MADEAKAKDPVVETKPPVQAPPPPVVELPVSDRASGVEKLMALLTAQDNRIKQLEAKASSIEGLVAAVKPQVEQAMAGGDFFKTVFSMIGGLPAQLKGKPKEKK
jgi:hypothetical protein